MYNTQSFSLGSSMPCGGLGRQDSNDVQTVISQASTDSNQERKPMLPQQLTPVLPDSVHRLPDPNVSASSGMMTSMVLPANFQVSAGLMRYHSAPGSFLATLIDDDRRNILTHVSGASPDSGFSQILSSDSSAASATHNGGVLQQNQSNPVNKIGMQDHSTSHPKRVSASVTEDFGKSNQLSVIIENGMESSENNYDEPEISLMYQNQGSRSNEQLLRGKLKQTSVLYSDLESCGENLTLSATKNTLSRQTSSPSAVLSRLACSAQRPGENGYVGVMSSGQTSKVGVTSEGMGVNHPANIPRQNSSPAELFAHLPMNMNFPHYAGKFNINRSQTPGETLAKCTTDLARLGNQEQGQPYVSAVSGRVWEEGTVIPESYEGLQNESYIKRGREMEETINPGKEDPRRNVMSTVANHHFGLYKSLSSDLSLEKILEDSVPCRIRAKRGCATHPRSIAERVRRTRISDRIRKLQELVPSMDKQTNTADMLDEAVEYVKFLQKQVQELTELQSKCTCGARQNEIDKAEQ